MMNTLTPRQIVTELDKYIVGQDDAKRAVAVALRNRYRRMLLPDGIRVSDKNRCSLLAGDAVVRTEAAVPVAVHDTGVRGPDRVGVVLRRGRHIGVGRYIGSR